MDTLDNPRRKGELNKVVEQAAEWFTLFEDGSGSVEERAAFAEWMAESPLHVRIFLNVSAVDRLLETVDPERELDLVPTGLRGANADIVPLTREQKRDGVLTPPRLSEQLRRPWFLKGLIAAAIALLAVAPWRLIPQWSDQQSYITGTGEQRSIVLRDGSIVHLNAKSRLNVRFSAQAREIHLLEGEALFKVQHSAAIPFRVFVDGSVVQALGTQFDINRQTARTTVSVIDGVVQVSKSDQGNSPAVPPTRLTAGESVHIVSNGKIAPRRPANVTQVTAWRQRRLVFDENTLADIAAEFNRYNRTPQLRVEGEEIRQRRYAAVFDADDPEPLLQFLRKDGDLAFESRGDELIIRPREFGVHR